MMVIIITCGFGVWPASYVVGGETSALHLRAKTQGIGWFAGGLSAGVSNVVLPYMYNHDQGDLRAKIGFIYAALCALGLGVTWFSVPEMKGRPAHEIDQMFGLKLRTRQFKQWVSIPDTDEERRNPERGSSDATP